MHRNFVYTTAFDNNDREILSASATTAGTPQNGIQSQEILAWNSNRGQSGSSGPAMSSATGVLHAEYPLPGSAFAYVASLPQISGSGPSLRGGTHTVPFLQVPADDAIFQAAHGSIPQVLEDQTTYFQPAHSVPYPQLPRSQTVFPQTVDGALFPQVSSGRTFPQTTRVSDTTSSGLGQEIRPLVIQATSMANFVNATFPGETDTICVFSPPQGPPAIQVEGHSHAEQRTISWNIRADAWRLPKKRYSDNEKTTIGCLVENDLPFSSIRMVTGSPKGTTGRFRKQPSEVQMVKIESRKHLDTYYFALTIRRVP